MHIASCNNVSPFWYSISNRSAMKECHCHMHRLPHPLGSYSPCNKVVFVHGPDPLADGGTGLGDFGDGGGGEVFVVN